MAGEDPHKVGVGKHRAAAGRVPFPLQDGVAYWAFHSHTHASVKNEWDEISIHSRSFFASLTKNSFCPVVKSLTVFFLRCEGHPWCALHLKT